MRPTGSDEQISRIIDRIYDVALVPSQWTDLLRDIGAVIGASQGTLMLLSRATKLMSDFGYGRNEEMVARYNTVFLGEDPWVDEAARRPLGTVVTGQELCPTPRFENTPYYQDCLRVGEIYDCLGVFLESGRGLNAAVSFQRPRNVPVFTRTETSLMGAFVPHLQRMIAIHRKFESLSFMSALQADVLDRLSFGVIIISASGGTHFVNPAAREVVAANDGLRLNGKGLIASQPDDNHILADAQTKGLGSPSGPSGRRGSTVAIRRPSMKRPYTVQIMPIAERIVAATQMFGGGAGFALITITDPERTRLPAAELLIQAYRLTPAEAALVLKIGAGFYLKEAADALHIAEETARWHLKRVLSKTETARQSELVSVLSTILAPIAE